ncbi:site-2 protease family protein [Demequina silvatica]|uniref:site-2 protease family protein n=1 Tax=Demequina silvatica TaxID=1638988 RepID=UPI0007839700|nr:site-2 protease family protein [Demequina silvatica]
MSQPPTRARKPRGITLGRVLGARIVLMPSTIVMALILAVFYAADEDGFSRQGFSIGLAVALLLFVSVFLHELAHTAAARGFKREVDEIVLTFFGGHTQFRSADPRPLEIGVIAAAGPLTNAVIGALALAASGALDGMAGRIVLYAGALNLILAGFNALPGSPLDGGRVVNAIVWAVSGDRWKGHRWAAQGGRIVAIGVIVVAVGLPILRGGQVDFVAAIWAMFLFSVIWPAASAELRAATVLGRRENVTALSLAAPAVGIPYDATVAQAREIAARAQAREVVVLAADGQAAGHFPVALTEAVPEEARAQTRLMSVTMPLVRGAQIPATATGERLVEAVVPWFGRTDVLVVVDEHGIPVGIAKLDEIRDALS